MTRTIFLCLTVLVFLVSGCGEGDDRVVVTIWHQKTGAERSFFNKKVEEYNSSVSDHFVRTLYKETEEARNLFIIASVGGQGPDLIFGPADNVSILAMTESVRPVSDVLEPQFLEQFSNNGIISWEGNPWMIADQVGNHLTFVYNKDIIPEPPETLSEMVDLLKAVTQDTDGDGRTDQYGLTWNYTEPFFFVPFLSCFGGSLMDSDGNPTLDNQATVDAIQFVLNLRDSLKVIPASTDYDTAETLFITGRSGAIINGPWSWAGYSDAGIDYGLTPIPKRDETGEWCSPYVAAKGYSINANTPDEKLPYVQQVLRYLTGPETQRQMAMELASIPVIESVARDSVVMANPVLQASLKQIEAGVPMPVAPQLRQIWDGMRGPYQLVMNGAVSAEEGARLMQSEIEKRIADTFL